MNTEQYFESIAESILKSMLSKAVINETGLGIVYDVLDASLDSFEKKYGRKMMKVLNKQIKAKHKSNADMDYTVNALCEEIESDLVKRCQFVGQQFTNSNIVKEGGNVQRIKQTLDEVGSLDLNGERNESNTN